MIVDNFICGLFLDKYLEYLSTPELVNRPSNKSPSNFAINPPAINRMTATRIFGIDASTWFSTLTIGSEIDLICNVSKAIVITGIRITTNTVLAKTRAIVKRFDSTFAADV